MFGGLQLATLTVQSILKALLARKFTWLRSTPKANREIGLHHGPLGHGTLGATILPVDTVLPVTSNTITAILSPLQIQKFHEVPRIARTIIVVCYLSHSILRSNQSKGLVQACLTS